MTTTTAVCCWLLLVIVGICAGFADAKNLSSKKAEDGKYIFYLARYSLWRAKVSDDKILSEKLVLPNNNRVMDYALDSANNRIYWLDTQGTMFTRKAIGESTDNLIFKISPNDKITLDTITNQFYVIESNFGHMKVIDSQGESSNSIFLAKSTDFIQVRLDPSAGFMFILNHGVNGKINITRANMDGSSPVTVVDDIKTSEFAIDTDSQRIYWYDAKKNLIESADYDGNARTTVAEVEEEGSVKGLTVHNGNLFWFSQLSFNRDFINTCPLKDGICAPGHLNLTRLDEYHLKTTSVNVQVLDLSELHVPALNPCQAEKVDCEHMCLLTSEEDKHKCVCKWGYDATGTKPNVCKPGFRILMKNLAYYRYKRQMAWDMYSQQPTLRPDPQQPQEPSHIPIYIFYPGK